MVTRVKQWQNVLSDHLKDQANVPFQWGVNDCMSSLAKYFEKMTDQVDQIWPEFAGYTTEEEAKAVIAAHGGIIAIINRFAGKNHSLPRKAQRGDIVVVTMPELTGGIVDDTGQRIALVTAKGLIRIPLSKAIQIWSF